jgi:hypothetical protein
MATQPAFDKPVSVEECLSTVYNKTADARAARLTRCLTR